MYTQDQLLQIVDSIRSEQSTVKTKAEASEAAFNLQMWSKSAQEALEEDGLAQVTSLTPSNAVLDALKMLDTGAATITVPASDNTKEAEQAVKNKQKFLIAVWDSAASQGQRDVMLEHAFNVLIHGVSFLRVLWVDDVIPEGMVGFVSEILITAGTFRECGVKQGPIYTEFGYWSSVMIVTDIIQRWPEYADSVVLTGGEDTELQVDDCWWVDRETGKVWNAVIIEGEWASEPAETAYPMVPIIRAVGDFSNVDGDKTANSLLQPILEKWRYHNRLLTQAATQTMEASHPVTVVSNEFGATVPDTPLRAREVIQVPYGTRIERLQSQAQLPITESMLQRTDREIAASLFPSVVSGESPPSMQAGYGLGILMSAASGRIKVIRRHLEISFRTANSLVLGLVEKFAMSSGIMLHGESPVYDGAFTATLRPEDVGGDFRNAVNIPLGINAVDTQLATLGIRLSESNFVSPETMRRSFLTGVQLPADEEQRVQLYKALSSPELQQAVTAKTLESYFGASWMEDLGLAQAQDTLGTSGNPNLGPGLGGPDPSLAAGVVPPEDGVAPIQPPAIGAGQLPVRAEGQLSGTDLEGGAGQISPEQLQELIAARGRG